MMRKRKMKKTRLIIYILMVVCVLSIITALVGAAYFAKGEFKDVFINKKDYFSADVLYSIPSLESEMREVGSSGVERQINIFNHDASTGDFNAFDVEFDVYAWLTEALPEGKAYVLSDGNGNSFNFTNQNEKIPVFQNLKLNGGERSTVTLTVDFGFGEDDDLTVAPGLCVVAVPSSPERLNKAYLGALIRPTRSDAFNIESSFDDDNNVDDYAAFTYRVNTVGIAPEGDTISIKWNSGALTLIRANGEKVDPDRIVHSDYGNGFDSMIEWAAQSDQSDYFVFFRNTENEMWNSPYGWTEVYSLITTEHKANTQE